MPPFEKNNRVVRQVEGTNHYGIWCPACKEVHVFDMDHWTYFNGDKDKPTFKDSMLIYEDPGLRQRSNDKHGHRCHSFVTDGKIQFLSDCTHSKAGRTIDLEPW